MKKKLFTIVCLLFFLILHVHSTYAQTNYIGGGVEISHGTWSKLTDGQGIKFYYERILTEAISAELEAGGQRFSTNRNRRFLLGGQFETSFIRLNVKYKITDLSAGTFCIVGIGYFRPSLPRSEMADFIDAYSVLSHDIENNIGFNIGAGIEGPNMQLSLNFILLSSKEIASGVNQLGEYRDFRKSVNLNMITASWILKFGL